jgi:hypothetical protein
MCLLILILKIEFCFLSLFKDLRFFVVEVYKMLKMKNKRMEKMNKRKIKLIVDGSSLDTIDLQIQWFYLVKLSWGTKI